MLDTLHIAHNKLKIRIFEARKIGGKHDENAVFIHRDTHTNIHIYIRIYINSEMPNIASKNRVKYVIN